ncbi:hypothetical protein [Kineococcus sp. SYSU DK001]|uniref:hypothetical protein n=1 Tax=Kineococcus sp. SYSU DK001 TaxID=3383122 RepID=UPI003D7E28BB
MSHDARRTPSTAACSQAPAPLSRRALVAAGFFGVLGSQFLLQGAGAPAATAAGALTLDGEGFTISASGGTVSLLDAEGVVRQRFTGYRLGALNLTSGTSTTGQAADGAPALVVTWDVPVPGASVTGTFTPRGRRLGIVYDIVSPGTASAANGMMRREAVPGPTVETFTGVADWVRDPRGGIPFQTNGRSVYEQDLGDRSLFIVAPGSNSSWRDSGALNLPAAVVSAGRFRAEADVALTTAARPVLVEALVAGRALAADVWTDRPYNVWESATAPLTVHGAVHNGGSARPVRFTWTAHDFDGTTVAERTRTVDAGAQATVSDDLQVELPGRGIAFVELTTTAGPDTSYARTNIAVLPPHEFVETSATSMFGLAADYLFGPPEERALIARLGVRHERHAHFTKAELERYGFTQHRLRTPASLDEFDGDPAALTAYVKSELDTAQSVGAIAYECANEWNMKGGVLKGVGAEKYVTKWATAFRAELDARRSPVKLVPVGLAGMDHVYAEKMFAAGLADVADAFNLHPGRGNCTPDWAPTPDTWTSGSTGSYWNYMGAVNEARRMIDEHTGGSMELWLTEAYTPTKPNSQWEDTYRHAAENTLLTLALAKSAGVTRALWFQFYDNVKANPTGASATNREYHFGLVLRDRSPKPSLLAYANAAEHLDESSFVRWFAFEQETLRGLLFDTPRGPLSILWSRADGYTLNTGAPKEADGFWPSPEPWVDTWRTRTTVQLPATGATVTQVDSIGRRTELPVVDGTVSVVLDGAPRMFYGLDVDGADEGRPVSSGPVSVKAQRVDDEVALAVHVRNDGVPAADVVITTSFGERRASPVPPGRAVYELFGTGSDSIPEGTVRVTVAGRNGKGRSTYEVTYAAFSTRPFA